jgi:hypothetical protein
VEFLDGVEEPMRSALRRELLRLLAHYLPEDQRQLARRRPPVQRR